MASEVGGSLTDRGARLLGGLGHPVKKVNDARLQAILRANDQQPVILNEMLQNVRAMTQVVGGSANVRANGVRDKSFGVLPEGCGQQGLDGGTDPVDDGAKIRRLVERGLAQLLHRGDNRSALRVPQHDRQPRPEARGSKLYAPDLRRRHDIPGYSDYEQVSKPLPKHELRGNARIGAPQDDSERLLSAGEREPMGLVERGLGVILARDKTTVALSQARECFVT